MEMLIINILLVYMAISILFAFFLLLLLCFLHKVEHFTNIDHIDKIVYINLDHRTDRRKEIETELKQKGLSYERFPAIKEERGAIGCCKSHLAVLKKAREKGYKNILVFEDDFHFIVDSTEFNKQIDKLFETSFDVCLLAYYTTETYDTENPLLYQIKNAQTTSGYIVQSHYYDTLIAQWEYGLKMFEETGNEPLYTCDQSWKPLQEKDMWVCFKNRTGIQRESYSDIQKVVVNPGT
jgi:glycosyl transferase family 25